MKSGQPKVLHKLAGLPVIQHVIAALQEASINNIIVVLGYQGELVEKILPETCRVAYQHEQLGTGHALMQVLPELERFAGGDCLVVCGDTPLLRAETLRLLYEKHRHSGAKATVLTALFPDPQGYGRIVRGPAGIERIVEEKDAALQEKEIKEINTGTYCFDVNSLKDRLTRLSAANAQGEYYLTDIVKMLVLEKEKIETVLLEDHLEAVGINNRVQLAEAGQILRRRILTGHMLRGVTVIDPEHTYVDAGVTIGQDTVLYPGVFLEGKTQVGKNCEIGPHTRITDSIIADNVSVTYSCLLEARVASGCAIGPFSFLRPGSVLAENVKIGDFVEVKKSIVGAGSKIPHLSYVGDSTLGENVNIGAGTITCNYDGFAKHPTVIGDGAFVGSNTNLVAPITVGPGAYIGAGSTVTRDIPGGALAVARGKQRNIENWKNRSPKEGPK
jgi:bifunctional UDP-N-acetylglucosamine pyrophosphorylase/glucosamine-1-phosphate N-acetyltransferase